MEPSTTKQCPFCKETIPAEKKRCPWCWNKLDPRSRSGGNKLGIGGLIVGALFFVAFPHLSPFHRLRSSEGDISIGDVTYQRVKKITKTSPADGEIVFGNGQIEPVELEALPRETQIKLRYDPEQAFKYMLDRCFGMGASQGLVVGLNPMEGEPSIRASDGAVIGLTPKLPPVRPSERCSRRLSKIVDCVDATRSVNSVLSIEGEVAESHPEGLLLNVQTETIQLGQYSVPRKPKQPVKMLVSNSLQRTLKAGDAVSVEAWFRGDTTITNGRGEILHVEKWMARGSVPN